MRKSAKIKNALIGVVGATALSGGALAVAAAPASAATASTATSWHGCYGYSCIGKYPGHEGCRSDVSGSTKLTGMRSLLVTLCQTWCH
jgi:hypothetical protein